MRRRLFMLIATVALLAVVLGCLTACGVPSDPDKAAQNLEDEGYIVVLNKVEAGADAAEYYLPDGCTACIYAYKKHELIGEGESIEIYYFKDKDFAAAYMKENEDWLNEIHNIVVEKENAYREGLITEAEFTAIRDILETAEIKQEGNLVYKGTAGAIKAAK